MEGPEPRLTVLLNGKPRAGTKARMVGGFRKKTSYPATCDTLKTIRSAFERRPAGKIRRGGIRKRIPGDAGENHRGLEIP